MSNTDSSIPDAICDHLLSFEHLHNIITACCPVNSEPKYTFHARNTMKEVIISKYCVERKLSLVHTTHTVWPYIHECDVRRQLAACVANYAITIGNSMVEIYRHAVAKNSTGAQLTHRDILGVPYIRGLCAEYGVTNEMLMMEGVKNGWKLIFRDGKIEIDGSCRKMWIFLQDTIVAKFVSHSEIEGIDPIPMLVPASALPTMVDMQLDLHPDEVPNYRIRLSRQPVVSPLPIADNTPSTAQRENGVGCQAQLPLADKKNRFGISCHTFDMDTIIAEFTTPKSVRVTNVKSILGDLCIWVETSEISTFGKPFQRNLSTRFTLPKEYCHRAVTFTTDVSPQSATRRYKCIVKFAPTVQANA